MYRHNFRNVLLECEEQQHDSPHSSMFDAQPCAAHNSNVSFIPYPQFNPLTPYLANIVNPYRDSPDSGFSEYIFYHQVVF
ncbi:hypothetical protein FVEG_00578 [Fusarium verticillioides 7600]|uniref:Uncharacterized protein n=1 Tax=Gibberella moniliformis (strain M3125 / FGSC 7600) TaxID=334819 RepID=W7LAL3_GIBM7|nr:hypothetical protein FVEG_00578 [Fusarium verticillioides 7600]EWG36648.1 hypothetical protein FVEG_00578 [Fusarium verticillioides 7600]